MNTYDSFEKYLVRKGLISEAALEKARLEAKTVSEPLLETLARVGNVGTEILYRALADFCEMTYLSLNAKILPKELAQIVPARFATHYNFVPVQERNGVLIIAICDPLNHQLLDDIRLVLKRRIEAVVSSPEEIKQALKTLYGVGADTVEKILVENESTALLVNLEKIQAGSDLGDEGIDASIIRFVNELLSEAIRWNATDVHIEPFENELRVRYRVDGILRAVPVPASIRNFQSAIVSRVKVMANLNIAEKRLPQDGKIRAKLGSEEFDLRVSILPTPYGETVNLRILNRASMFLTLEQLGFLPQDLAMLERFIRRPHGMILVTGPTGSGKTTTLYAALSKLNAIENKIVTIEDPIEYQLHGITQMQVMPQIGFDFSNALRSILRHDPDIILVGEIRDYETAEMAIRAGLTGHLVFSTLHTNDAAGAVTRLIDLGVEPFLVASTMIASIAQRLVRSVCEDCAEPFEPDKALLLEMGATDEEIRRATFRRGRGCEECRNTGFRGRTAIYEILPFTPEIKQLTIERAPSNVIKRKACELGMRTLRQSGWERICQGRTTFEEVLRITSDADLDM